MKRWRDRIDVLAALSFVAQIGSGVLMFLILGPSPNGPGYLVVPDLIAGFGKSLNISLQATVQIFAFVGYAALCIRALWDLGVTLHRVFFVQSAKQILELNGEGPTIALPTRAHLLGRATANLFMATFNFIAVITVLGLFSVGMGLVFAAVATGIAWVKDSVIPWTRTRKTIQELQQFQFTDELHFEKINGQISRMESECRIQRNSMILNGISFFAFSLFATGPFGFFTLGMVGSVLIVACTAVGIGRIICNSCMNNTPALQDLGSHNALKFDEESEFEFHHRIKFHHWMEETGKKLDCKPPIHYPAILQAKQSNDRSSADRMTQIQDFIPEF